MSDITKITSLGREFKGSTVSTKNQVAKKTKTAGLSDSFKETNKINQDLKIYGTSQVQKVKAAQTVSPAEEPDYSVDSRIVKVANILVDYSTEVKPGEGVYVQYAPDAKELAGEIQKQALKKGASRVIMDMADPQVEYNLLAYGNEEQIKDTGNKLEDLKKCQVWIGLGAPTNTNQMSNIDPKKLAMRNKATREVQDYRVNQMRWVITRMPTSTAASDAKMSDSEYKQFIYQAIIQDWSKQNEIQDQIKERLDKAKEVHLVGENTDLTFSIAGRESRKCVGKRNIPDGEIYIAPVRETMNGHVQFTYPALSSGGEIPDVYLEYKDGELVKYTTSGDQERLNEMINTDDGAKYFGEFGIGTNYQIDKFTRNTLFDEKIGGSIHLALGNPYEGTGGTHKSSIHVDIVKDLRNGGGIYLDGKPLQENGKFSFDEPAKDKTAQTKNGR